MTSRKLTRVVLLALFFLSGVAGLIYQIVWTRNLVLVFGNTLLANSTVLSAFMAGLAAGSFALGEYIDKRPRDLVRLYAILEAGIGLFGLAFPIVVALATPFYEHLYAALNENLVVLNLIRFSLCFLLILVPTFFMGGTLPVLVKYAVEDLRRIGYQVGFLYGLNTAGAVAGCIAAGYWLLGAVGMRQTSFVAVAINLAVALVAWALGRSRPRRSRAEDSSEQGLGDLASRARQYPKKTVVTVLLGIGLSGFCALAYEVLWARMLNLFLNNNIYSFTATIATFLAGIALGSLIYSQVLSRVQAKLRLFAAVEIGIGLLACAVPYLLSLLQAALFSKPSEALTLLKTSVVMIAPAVLMGVAVPLAVQICQWGAGREGRSVGVVYAFNTIGSILGAFVAGFLLIPSVGLHMALLVVASLNLGAGFLVLVSRAGGRNPAVLAGMYASLVAILVVTAPPSLFREIYQKATPGSEILHYKEGKVVNVVVYDFFKAGYKDLHLNGIEEASSRLWHVQLFKLLGVLPVAVHQDPDEALMIAFGAGMSAGASIAHVDSLDCVDLNPDIYGPAKIFYSENLGVIDNPKLNILENDGRNELLLSPKKYSVIISDATNPKMYDSWTLYTREFYELTKRRLQPGGVFAQWLVVPLPGDSVKVILNTFRAVYPHMSLWCIYGSSQCLMLGTPERLRFDYESFSRQLEPMLTRSEFTRYGVSDAAKFLSFLLLGEDEVGRLLTGFEKISTDDLPHPQFQLDAGLGGTRTMLEILKHQAFEERYMATADGLPAAVTDRMRIYRSLERRLYLGFLLNNRNEYLEAAEVVRMAGFPDDANVASALRHDHIRQTYFESRVAQLPNDANAFNNLGYIYWMNRDYGKSIEAFERALELEPSFANARSNLAQVLIDVGLLDEAETALLLLRETNPTFTTLNMVRNRLELVGLLRKLRYEPDSASRYLALSDFFARNGESVKAVSAAESAAQRAPRDPAIQIKLAALYEDLEFVSKARTAYEKAARLVPHDLALRERTEALGRLERDPVALQRALAVDEAIMSDLISEAPNHPDSCSLARRKWDTYDFEGTIDRVALRNAARLFEETISRNPEHLHAYLDAATILEALGDYGAALEVLQKAVAVEPESQGLRNEARRLEQLHGLHSGSFDQDQRGLAWLEVGELYRSRGDGELAVEALTRAIEEGNDGTASWLSLAQALIEIGKYEDARRSLYQAGSREPNETKRTPIQQLLQRVEQVLSRPPSSGEDFGSPGQ